MKKARKYPHFECRSARKVHFYMSIRILLADDHAMVRHGLSCSISQQEDMEVVGQSCDGLMTVKLVAELVPDVVIMDISMPFLNGFEATREIIHDFPDMK